MKKYALKRIVTSLFTLLAILLVLFILMQLMPGSPFNDEKLNADQRAALYTKYGLDQPLPTVCEICRQYVKRRPWRKLQYLKEYTNLPVDKDETSDLHQYRRICGVDRCRGRASARTSCGVKA